MLSVYECSSRDPGANHSLQQKPAALYTWDFFSFCRGAVFILFFVGTVGKLARACNGGIRSGAKGKEVLLLVFLWGIK